MTECNPTAFTFQPLGNRAVVAQVNGGTITADAGLLLLRELEARRHIIKQFAACFTDHRQPDRIEHPLADLLAQRVFGLVLGYEDLNDHDLLRADPLLATALGKLDPTGRRRRRAADRGKPLAGKSTLNRLELRAENPAADEPYKKIAVQPAAVEALFVALFLQAQAQAPTQVVLDLDATDDRLHGQPEGRFFHGYYGHYCYLPLYIFCGDSLLGAKLRPANQDQSAGALAELQRIVEQLRAAWPEVAILVRGDSGFARDDIMAWCEANGVDYLFGVAKNARLLAQLERHLEQARLRYEITGQAARVFADFRYRTRDSWSRERRVVGKAEHLAKGANPRFIVTSLGWWEVEARTLYEQTYCQRGEMENRIKEQQLELFADRTSAHSMAANQLRLWLSSLAYVMLNEIRRLGLAGTAWAQAQCGTIRRKVLKIGAQVVVSVRRVVVRLANNYAYPEVFAHVYGVLRGLPPLRC